MAGEDFVHHLPYQGLPSGRTGMRAVENHIYRIVDGRITELWPAGGPQL